MGPKEDPVSNDVINVSQSFKKTIACCRQEKRLRDNKDMEGEIHQAHRIKESMLIREEPLLVTRLLQAMLMSTVCVGDGSHVDGCDPSH